MIYLFLSGIAVGILASSPLGPGGILCVQRTLNRGRGMGFLSGCGIACADTIFAIVAVSSMSFIKNLLNEVETPLQLVVSIIVIVVGISIATTNPIKQFKYRKTQQNNPFSAFISIFLLTINPVNLLPVLFFTGALKIGVESFVEGAVTIAGVLCGALAWWLGITSLVAHYRKFFRLRHIMWINRILGTIILVLGVSACVVAIVKIVEKWV